MRKIISVIFAVTMLVSGNLNLFAQTAQQTGQVDKAYGQYLQYVHNNGYKTSAFYQKTPEQAVAAMEGLTESIAKQIMATPEYTDYLISEGLAFAQDFVLFIILAEMVMFKAAGSISAVSGRFAGLLSKMGRALPRVSAALAAKGFTSQVVATSATQLFYMVVVTGTLKACLENLTDSVLVVYFGADASLYGWIEKKRDKYGHYFDFKNFDVVPSALEQYKKKHGKLPEKWTAEFAEDRKNLALFYYGLRVVLAELKDPEYKYESLGMAWADMATLLAGQVNLVEREPLRKDIMDNKLKFFEEQTKRREEALRHSLQSIPEAGISGHWKF